MSFMSKHFCVLGLRANIGGFMGLYCICVLVGLGILFVVCYFFVFS